ncbi:MAG: 16S rRNA (cytidine(1402)-2'-O)-methyltransferase, partial [Pseudomonadota bacterium]
KGEIVLVIGPPEPGATFDDESVDQLLRQALSAHSLRDAVDHVASHTGRPRRQIYRRALTLSNPKNETPSD